MASAGSSVGRGGGSGGVRIRRAIPPVPDGQPPPPLSPGRRPKSKSVPHSGNQDLVQSLLEMQKDPRPRNMRTAFPDMACRLQEVNRSRHIWFNPSLSKSQATDILAHNKPCSFVVRESQREPGGYTISVRVPENVVRQSQNPPIPPDTYVPASMCVKHYRIKQRSQGGYSIPGWGECYFDTISEWVVAFTVLGPDPRFVLELPERMRYEHTRPSSDSSYFATTDDNYARINDNFVIDGKEIAPKDWYTSLLTRALKEGKVKVRTSVMTMHGAPGTGKSSFQDLILNRPPLPVRHSTPLTMCPVRTMAGEKAFVNSTSDDASCKWMSIRPDTLMDLLAKTVKNVDKMYPESPSSPTPRTPSPLPSQAQPHSKSEGSQRPRTKMFQGIRNKLKKPVVIHEPGTPATSQVVPAPVHDPPPTVQPAPEPQIDSSQTAQNLLDLMFTAAKSDQLLKVHWIYIIDSGGQPQFQDILPLFVRNNMINVITFRLSQKLDDKPIFEFVHEGQPICQPSDLQVTNLELIQSLVRSLCTFQQSSDSEAAGEDGSGGARFVLVGTFADKVNECEGESIEDKNQRLVEALEAYEGVRVDYDTAKGEVIVAVNAVVTEDREKEADRMRQILTRALEATGIQETEVPLRWFVLELDISRIAMERNQFVLQLSECVEAGRKLGMSKQEVIEALLYFHRSALYLYFPDVLPLLVFVNPQPLLDKLTELIVISFADCLDLVPIRGISAGHYQRLKKEGIFNLSLLKCLPACFIKGVFEEEEFLKLLEYLLVVAPIRQEGKVVEYFLPCVLPRQSLTKEQKHNFISKSDPWVVTWSSKPTPLGLFPATIVHLFTRQDPPFFKPPNKTKQFPCQLRNAVRLACISHGGAVLIVDNHCWMEVYYSGEPSLCPVVRKAVFDAILSAGRKLHYADLLKSMQEGFLCMLRSECTLDPHPCTVTTLPNTKMQATCSIDQEVSGMLADRKKLAWLGGGDDTDSPPASSPPPSDQLVESDLMNDLAARIPNRWKSVGIQLGLTSNQLDAIADTHDPINRFMMMLNWWQRLDKMVRPCSWSTIVKALRTNAVQEERLANELETKYCYSDKH